MKMLVAFMLIIVSMASSQTARHIRGPVQQGQNSEASPYNPSGWRPSGPPFNTPERSNNQQSSLPSASQQSYGPPSQQSYVPPSQPQPSYETPLEEEEKRNSTTSEPSTENETTENLQVENIRIDSESRKIRIGAEKPAQTSLPEKYFLFVPRGQSQNIVISENSLTKEAIAPVIPVSHVYELPVKVPQKAAALVSVEASPLQIQKIVPISSFYKNGIYTPFSSAFVQIYQ